MNALGIGPWIDARLQAIQLTPEAFGGPEVVEQSVLLLLEAKFAAIFPELAERNPRWVLNEYNRLLWILVQKPSGLPLAQFRPVSLREPEWGQQLDRFVGLLMAFRDHFESCVRTCRASVAVLVTGSDGKLLLQKIASTHSRSPNKLGSSAASYMKSVRSDPLSCAQFAAQDEIGIYVSARHNLAFCGDVAIQEDDHTRFVSVFLAKHNGPFEFNKNDRHVESVLWVGMDELKQWVKRQPDDFTATFRAVFDHVFGAKRP